MKVKIAIVIAALIAATSPGFAQNVTPAVGYAQIKAMPIPVIDGDITDRPYRVVGNIQAGVRKATAFSKDPSREKVYRELWERAVKLGADAVLQASFGEARVRGFSWGSR